MNIRTRRLGRNQLSWLAEGPGGHGAQPVKVAHIEESIAGRFRFVEATAGKPGLRSPQLGALHAILAAESLEISAPVTVVLPTGTGKTETMLAAYCNNPTRTLVVVPSDSLRTQIGRKFATLGVLPLVAAIEGDFRTPTVGIVRSRLETAQDVHDLAAQSCVIVATAAALSRFSAEATQALVAVTSRLFIDEAHHIAATTWARIAAAFSGKLIVQFTATPFREDGRILEGRIVYAYPLRLAQEHGWFAKIQYRAVSAEDDADRSLALAAVAQLRHDLAAGLDHLLMARVQTIDRAKALLELYYDIAGDLGAIRIDSKLSLTKQREARGQLDQRASRIVVCVDMLGEGFDLPALKVAAVHDPHKSLAVTLQFVGRFTRVGGEELGDASVFVPRATGVSDERLRRLYGEDADWNVIVRDLTHAEIEHEQARTDFEAGFSQLPTEVAVRAVQPKMSTVIYRSPSLGWMPEGIREVFGESSLLTKRIAVNHSERVLWFVTAESTPVLWSDVSAYTELVHHLYVIHADMATGLLYINSSNNDLVHSELAQAVGGDEMELIRGDIVFRVLSPIKRRVPTNVGLLDAVNRNRRFTMHVGADVLEGFGPGAAQKSKTNIFAHGYADHSRVSVGASRKGRIWSHRVAPSILDWVKWARTVGAVVTDTSIDVKTVLSGFIIPRAAHERPPLVPLGVEWPHDLGFSTSESRQIGYAGSAHPLIDVEMIVTSFNRDEPIRFAVVSPDWSLDYEFEFGADRPKVRAMGADASLQHRGENVSLAQFMSDIGLTVFFENEALLSPDGYILQPDRSRPRFPESRLEALDWSGVDIRKESQGPHRDKDSVQNRVAEILALQQKWEVIVDDDGTREVADLVFLRREGQKLHVLLVHCKFSHGDAPGARLADLYEVCGQAVKCYKARSDIELTIKRVVRRERRRQSNGCPGILGGSMDLLLDIQRDAWRLDPVVTVAVAQPGLSTKLMSLAQSELLGCVDLYLSEAYGSGFRVLCSG